MRTNKAAPAAAEPVTRRWRKPDFTGVPGVLIKLAELPEDLHWGSRLRTSPYDALLKQLSDAGKGAVLRFLDVKARTSVAVRARKLGYRISFAESDSKLYVRLDGKVEDDVAAERRRLIVEALKVGGPKLPMALCNFIRAKSQDTTIDANTVECICGQLVREGALVKQEGRNYALNPKVKAATA